MSFEMVVLDTALTVTTDKFNHNLSKMSLIFKKLHQITLDNPSDKTLKKFLAFKKSLMTFETRYLSTKEPGKY